MTYTHRQATSEDALALAPLWKAFARERATVDPSMVVKPDFDFEKYIASQLAQPLSMAWIIESNAENKTIVGCLFIYFYDEAPPPSLPADMLEKDALENPFQPRRLASVLGMYVEPEHRKPGAIKLLAEAGIQKAEEMKVSDIDVLVGADQTGIHALLERAGFAKAAVQYTKHYPEILQAPTADTELPSLHPPHPDLDLPEIPKPGAIPLRDPKTNELVRSLSGEPVFLMPLTDEAGELLETSSGLPIYPTPARDPQTQDWVFNAKGGLVVAPLLRDESGQIIERQGIPQFYPPAYQWIDGKLTLKQDAEGNYIFREVERDKEGQIVLTPDGAPVFKEAF